MKEHSKIIACVIIFFAIIILTAFLLLWCDYQSQQRSDKLAEETRSKRLECYEKYKNNECFRI